MYELKTSYWMYLEYLTGISELLFAHVQCCRGCWLFEKPFDFSHPLLLQAFQKGEKLFESSGVIGSMH
jgi:hypothetical protein